MHEYSLVQELITLARTELRSCDQSGRVLGMTVTVGPLSGASPEAMEMAFTMLVAGTDWEGARLAIDRTHPVCRCRECGQETEISEYVFACPTCDGLDFTINGGDELQLTSIDIED